MLASPRTSTAEFTDRGASTPYGAQRTLAGRSTTAAAESRAPVTLAPALLLAILYAASAPGAVGYPTEARLQVLIAAIAAGAGAAWLWSGTLRLAASRVAVIGAVLLAAFAVWSGVTVPWSVAARRHLDRAQPGDQLADRARGATRS